MNHGMPVDQRRCRSSGQFRQEHRAHRGPDSVPTRDHTIAERSKNYRYVTHHQVVIDADTRTSS
jgi:hypothetical protein